ncbi:MAG: OsmC family protein [Candidatus Brocadiia bacterium]
MYQTAVNYIGPSKFKISADNYSVNIDFPRPNQPIDGLGPIPMMLGALGGCVAVYLERYLVGKKIPFKGFSIDIKSDLTKESPHFLKIIDVKVSVPGLNLDKEGRDSLMRFIANCPVHNTLHNNPTVNISLAN